MPFVRQSLSRTDTELDRCLTRIVLVISIAAITLAIAAASASAHSASQSDAVIAWNANAGDAALAACIAPTDNPLHESRLYAMTHVAIHDALNAIESRAEPYAFDGRARKGASAEAAVAAAARDVLVSLLPQIPFPLECTSAGVASVEADYAVALSAIPNGRAKTRGLEVGREAAEAILALRDGDGSDTQLQDFDYRQGTEPGVYRFTPGFDVRFRTGLARCDSLRAGRQLPVPSRPSVPGDRTEVRGRSQRGQASGWRRRHHAKRAHCRGDRDRPLLGRELAAAMESHHESSVLFPEARSMAAGAAVRAAQSEHGGWLRRLVRHQVPLQLLAAGHRDPERGCGRQPANQRRLGLDPVGTYAPDPRLRLGARRRGRHRIAGAEALLRHRPHRLRDLQPDACPKTRATTRRRGSVGTPASPRRPRRTGSRAFSSDSTSARPLTKESHTATRSATLPSIASCGRSAGTATTTGTKRTAGSRSTATAPAATPTSGR